MQQQISIAFALAERAIVRQSSRTLVIQDGAGSTITVRGATALEPHPWATYDGQYGRWQARISPTLRVGMPWLID